MVRVERAILAFLVATALAACVRGQSTTADVRQVNQIPPPPTKLEGFEPTPGSIVTMGRDALGSVMGISVDAREMRETGQAPVRGLVVQVTDAHTERSYIDADELPALLNGIAALLEVSTNPTQFDNFEVRYVTRGSLQITAFNRSSQVLYTVQVGRLETARKSGLTVTDMKRLQELFAMGAQKLASVTDSGP
jgi:hypothetical protein